MEDRADRGGMGTGGLATWTGRQVGVVRRLREKSQDIDIRDSRRNWAVGAVKEQQVARERWWSLALKAGMGVGLW